MAPLTQVELASILKFVLDNEESLNENLETFLLRKGKCGACQQHPTSTGDPFLEKQNIRFLLILGCCGVKAAAPPSSEGLAGM